jgi:hypothetical protein
MIWHLDGDEHTVHQCGPNDLTRQSSWSATKLIYAEIIISCVVTLTNAQKIVGLHPETGPDLPCICVYIYI